jgi:hypothetical protein
MPELRIFVAAKERRKTQKAGAELCSLRVLFAGGVAGTFWEAWSGGDLAAVFSRARSPALQFFGRLRGSNCGVPALIRLCFFA